MKINFTLVLIVIVLFGFCNSVYAQDTLASKNRDEWHSDSRPSLPIKRLNPLYYLDSGTELLSSKINNWLAEMIADVKFTEPGTNILRVYGRFRSRWQEQDNFDFDEADYDLQHFQHNMWRAGLAAITTEFRVDFEFFNAVESSSTRLNGEPDADEWDIHRLTFMLTGYDNSRIRLAIPYLDKTEWVISLMGYLGRGPVTLGRGRLIGSNDWPNTGDTFDEIVVTTIFEEKGAAMTFFGLRDVVYSRNINDSEYGTEVWGVALIGIDPFNQIDDLADVENRALLRPGDYDFELYPPNNSKETRNILGIDLYALWIYRDREDITSELGRVGNYNITNVGLRAGFELVKNWIFEFEGNYQFGKYGNSIMRAFAFHAELTGGFSGWLPVSFTAAVGYASGDPDPKDGIVETFYDVFGNTNPRFGSIDMLGWRNLINVSFDARFQLFGDFMLKAGGHIFENAQGKDAIYGTKGTVLLDRGVGEPYMIIGYLFNGELQYHYSERIYLFGGMSYFQPGSRLKSVLLDDSAIQYYITAEIRY